MNKNKLSARSCKCEGCGDDMIFSPADGMLYCPSCASKKEIKTPNEYSKHPMNEFVDGADDNKKWAEQQKSMDCPNCGAEVVLGNYQVAARCPYCSSELVARKKSLVGLTPDAVVPFKIGKDRALELFRTKINKNHFVPGKFKKQLKADSIEGYYFPAFVYDAQVRSDYEGRLYENYVVKRGDRSEVRRRYFYISGNKVTKHEGVEVEASTKLTQAELQSIRPYDFVQAKAFAKEYIAGFPLETYSVGVKDTNKQAREIIESNIRWQILKGYHYDGVSFLNINNFYEEENYSYCVLPMYRINYQYKNKKYSNVINGQSGRIGGSIPKSGFKIALTILAPILFIAAIIIISCLVV